PLLDAAHPLRAAALAGKRRRVGRRPPEEGPWTSVRGRTAARPGGGRGPGCCLPERAQRPLPAPRPGCRVRRAARGGGLAAYFRSTRFPAGRSCLSASNRASALGGSQSPTAAPPTLALRAIGTVPATPSPLLTERSANGKRIRWEMWSVSSTVTAPAAQ